MTLMQCNECGKEVSTKARECPNCGAPVKAKKAIPWVVILFICAVVVFIAFAVGKSNNKPSLPSLSICYELGYRIGRCAGMAMNGANCAPEDEFVMPSMCNDKPETNNGMQAGMQSVDKQNDKLRLR